MIVRILLRRDTTANWQAVNPVLGDGELGIERLPDNSIKLKFGNGTDTWNNLSYNPVNNPQFIEHLQDLDAHGLDAIKDGMVDLQTDISTNQTNIGIIQSDISGLESDVSTIQTDIGDIQSDITDINDKLSTIDIVSIRGTVDTFADLQNIDPSTLLVGSAYIVEQDETRNGITTVYAVIENNGVNERGFIAEFTVDLSNFYDKTEIDSKLSIINTNVQAITNAAIRNDVTAQQNIISDLSMGNNKITDVAPPTTSDDVANKQYVDMKAGSIDYSLTEKDTGVKWIDGSPIYRRVFTGNLASSGIATSITNAFTQGYVKDLIKIYGSISQGTFKAPIPYIYSNASNALVDFTGIHLQQNINVYIQHTATYNNKPFLVIVEYTKN
jgi:hypothetical protein